MKRIGPECPGNTAGHNSQAGAAPVARLQAAGSRHVSKTIPCWMTALLLTWQLSCGPPQSLAGPIRLTEGQIKAACLYNFAQYVEWPATAFAGSSSPLVISILGKNNFGGSFGELTQKTVRKRRIVVRQISRIEDLGESQILFIGASERGRLPYLLSTLKTAVLTVSDIKQFARAGGMISLVTQEDRVSFEINLKAARQADLKLSSNLLKLAHSIIE